MVMRRYLSFRKALRKRQTILRHHAGIRLSFGSENAFLVLLGGRAQTVMARQIESGKVALGEIEIEEAKRTLH